MYQALLGEHPDGLQLVVPQMHTVCQSVEVAGQILGSKSGRHKSLSYILAAWAGRVGRIEMDKDVRPGQIQHFIHHRICWGGIWHDFLLAAIQWNYGHDMRDKFDEITLWCANHYEDEGPSSYMPVQRITSLFCPAYDTVADSQVMFPCSLSLKLCF